MIEAPAREEAGVRGEALVIRGGPRGALARQLNRSELWGRRLPANEYIDLLRALLDATESYGIVRSVSTSFDKLGWQIAASAVCFVAGEGREDGRDANTYFAFMKRSQAHSRMEATVCLAWRVGNTQRRLIRSAENSASGGFDGARRIRNCWQERKRICAKPANPMTSFPYCSAHRPWNWAWTSPR
jgi:hypothetical protein